MSRDTSRALTQFFGGRICLDFANTVDWRTSEEPQELIPDYAALLAWSAARHTLPQAALARLEPQAAGAAAAAVLVEEAHALRAQIWQVAEALRRGGVAPLAAINRALARVPPQPRLICEARRYVHDLAGSALDEPLRPVLWSLTALLASDDAGRVGCCSAQGCGWFFVDESPNHTRLWCSSEVCGNRERARRAYAKRRVRATRTARPKGG
jgi:predicted RNA-binding Zn ribbon-like protein